MQMEYFYYLIRLVEAGSLSKAASSLYLSPQGLSKAIQKMNHELGVTIFYRDKNGLHLTVAGNEVYSAAKQIVAINDQMSAKVNRFASVNPNAETLVYSSSHMNVAVLHRELTRFQRKHPSVKIRLVELPQWELRQISRPMADNEIRFISVIEPGMNAFLSELGNHGLFHELGRTQVMCRVSTSSDLARREEITRNDLQDRSIALFTDEIEVVDTLLGSDIGSQVSVQLSNYGMLCDIISNDKSLVGITDSLIEQQMTAPQVRAIPLKPEFYTVYGYILGNEITPTPVITELIKSIRENL